MVFWMKKNGEGTGNEIPISIPRASTTFSRQTILSMDHETLEGHRRELQRIMSFS